MAEQYLSAHEEVEQMSSRFFPVRHIIRLNEQLLGKNISVRLINGDVYSGRVGWYSEGAFDDEAPDGVDWGVVLENAEQNGTPLGGMLVSLIRKLSGSCPLRARTPRRRSAGSLKIQGRQHLN